MSKGKGTFEKPVAILLAAGVGCFVLSFVAMGTAPWTSLNRVTSQSKDEGNPYYDDKGQLTSVGRGRKIYIREACWHCHSQFVRPVAGEPFRYGPPSQPWEARYDIPQTYGTRRVGPDLSRQAGRHSNDWHIAHLYNPRITVPVSVMPSYPWLFEKRDGGIVVPKQEAKDLVAYLQYLGAPYKREIQEIVYPRFFKVAGSPARDKVNLERGQTLFRENCLGCHGSAGDGEGVAAQFLQPRPADLSERFVSPSETYAVLNRGVIGSAMPSFREMPERDLWAIAHYVSTLGDKTREESLTRLARADEKARAEKGRKIYETRCVACHGARGAGDGPAAAAFNPRPKDFTRRVFSVPALARIMRYGVPGSQMPPFGDLQGEDVEAVAAHLSSLHDKEL
jgi:cbb3-type cytochrome oxidase cytochrome c subunit